jgi:hypothetical protein
MSTEEQATSIEEQPTSTEEEATGIPIIRATFELDADGRPTSVESGNLRHYHIKLHVDGAPPDTYAVTYVLDPSYPSPVREVLDSKAAFAEHLTSYGDYTVQAKIRARDGITTVAVPLARALAESYSEAPSPAIASALQDIAAH